VIIPAVLIAVGLLVRLTEQFVRNPPMSLDESFLAINLIERSWGQLAGTLDFNQGAPLGFLWLEKGSITVLGREEGAFRFVPFVAGALALVAFLPVAGRALRPAGQYIALGLFAGSSGAIIYATTAKQYSLDLFATVLLTAVAFRLLDRPSSPRLTVFAAGVGSATLWFSHASALVLAAIFIVLTTRALHRRATAQLRALAVIGGSWCISFLAVYELNIRRLSGLKASLEDSSTEVGNSAVAGEWTDTARSLDELARRTARSLRDLLGIVRMPIAGVDVGDAVFLLVAIVALTGAICLIRRDRWTALLLFSPIALLLIAAGIGQYPIFPRTTLFLLPSICIASGEAGDRFLSLIPGSSARQRLATALALSLVVMPIAFGLPSRLRENQKIRDVLSKLASAERRNQSLYIHFPSQYRVRYYLSCDCFASQAVMRDAQSQWALTPGEGGSAQWAPALASSSSKTIIGKRLSSDPSVQATDFLRLRSRGDVWILASDLTEDEYRTYLGALRTLGTEVRTIGDQKPGEAFATLFHFARRSNDSARPTRALPRASPSGRSHRNL
jgi:hypothetical protein